MKSSVRESQQNESYTKNFVQSLCCTCNEALPDATDAFYNQAWGGRRFNLYQHCSHHFPEDYPIYDSYVEKMLMHFKRVDKFYKFKKDDLKHYPTYHAILVEFSRFYELEGFTLKEVDKYLWQAGKKYFPKQYWPLEIWINITSRNLRETFGL